MKTVILLFLLSLFAQQSLAQYEYFKLVVQWPPTACLTFSCTPLRKPHQNFTLHGIWPSNYSGYEPRDCYTTNHLPRVVFTAAMVQSLFPRINISWPDLKSGNEEGFWGKQWDNHGTCSQQKFNVLSYFKLALDNKDRVDILNQLVLRKINPDLTKLYPIVRFENAIMLVTKKIPELRCIVHLGVVYLFEVGLCLDAAGSNFIDCVAPTQTPVNRRVRDCKGKNVRLLPL